MLKLLREHQVGPNFTKFKKNSRAVSIAVPFWGTGAIATLGLNDDQSAKVLCNLSSPACNPYVIAELKKNKRIQIRTHPRLHAKIYGSKSFVIVGSSNASKRGLTLEGEMSKSWIEANILSDNKDLVNSALSMFTKIWKSGEAKKVTQASLKKAQKDWDTRPRPDLPRSGNQLSLLEACRRSPHLFGSVYVLAYDEPLDPMGSKSLAEIRKRGRSPSEDSLQFRNAWGYQIGPVVKRDSWLIDLDCRDPKKVRVWGCSKVALRLAVEGETDLTIATRGVVQLSAYAGGLRLTAADKAALVSNSRRILNRFDGVVPLTEVIRMIDRKQSVTKRRRS